MLKQEKVRGKKNSYWIDIILLVSSSLTIMSSATIAPSLPQMSEVFREVPHAAFLSKLILTLPALLIAVGAPLAGIVIDQFGRKKLIIAGLLFYAAAGSAGLYLDSLYLLLLSRALLGFAVAAIMTTCTTLIGDYFEGEKRNRFMGLQGAVMAMGGVIYILIGGFLADISWRGPFAIYLFSLVLLIPAIKFLYEPKSHQTYDKNESDSPDLPVPVKTIVGIFVTGFIGMVVFYMVPVQIPFLLKEMGPVSNSEIGYAIASSTLAGAIVAALFQKIKRYLSFTVIYAVTFGVMAIAYIIISNADTYGEVIIGLLVNGLGMGLMMPNGSTWLMIITPVKIRGRVVGGMTMAVFIGQFLSPLVIQPLVANFKIQPTFKYIGIFMFIITAVFIISAIIDRRRKLLTHNFF